MRRTQPAPIRGIRSAKRRRALPQGMLWHLITLTAAVGILLAGYLTAIGLDRVLPSGKGVLAVDQSRDRLDKSWLTEDSAKVTLAAFPYGQAGGGQLQAPDKDGTLTAIRGMKRLLTLTNEIIASWQYDPNAPAQTLWINQYDSSTMDLQQYLRLDDMQAKIDSGQSKAYNDAAVEVPAASTAWPTATPQKTQRATDASAGTRLDDAEYAAVWQGTQPGLSGSPDRWVVYRLPAAWIHGGSDEKVDTLYLADVVYHPALGVTHLFLHASDETFPTSFHKAGGEIALQYIKAHSAEFLTGLLKLANRDKVDLKFDGEVGPAWQSQGNTQLADISGLISAEADGCYVSGDLCAVSFPCEGGGHLLVYVDAATMNIRGFTRQYQ